MKLLKYFWLGYLIPNIFWGELVLDKYKEPCIMSGRKPNGLKAKALEISWLGISVMQTGKIVDIEEEDSYFELTVKNCSECGGRAVSNNLGVIECLDCEHVATLFPD